MKKKLLLIFFIVLIVIFLMLFLNKSENINEIINNTINKKDEYKITLTLKNIYSKNKTMSTKIKYIEEKKNDLYKFTNKIYENETLTKESITYLDKNTFYYKDGDTYKQKEIKDISKIKDFNINYSSFFKGINKVKKIKTKDNKTYYKAKMKSEDAFSLIYDNPNNDDLDKYTYVYLVSFNNEIEEIYYSVKDKKTNTYYVDLKIDFGLQNIELDIN